MTTVVGSKALIRGKKQENLIGVCQTTTKKTEGSWGGFLEVNATNSVVTEKH